MSDDAAPGFLALIGYGGPYVERAPVLLDAPPSRERRRHRRHGPVEPRACEVCALVFTPAITARDQRTCSRSCGSQLRWRTR